MRLRRADPSGPGYHRHRRGKGFSYADVEGRPLTDPAELGRVRALAIPPAWTDVWICPYPNGHIQAVGTDAAGRRQYRYHDVWRAKRDAAKFDHVLAVAELLPELRARVARALSERGPTKRRVLAAAVRLLDEGVFRVGSEEYESSYGLATLRRDHVRVRGSTLEFRYPAKGGVERAVRVVDAQLAPLVRLLLRRPDDHPDLLAYREGRTGWRDVRSADINEYLKETTGCEISAKDFRTWHATVVAAVALAGPRAREAGSPTARKRAVSRAVREVAEYLGNTPAVARASYVDPRVVDRYYDGGTIATTLSTMDGASGDARDDAERAVLDLLRDA
jgi:DNA topoisomerase I